MQSGSRFARVAVIGGGTMGRDIAYVHLAAGHDVTLLEADDARLAAAVQVIRGHLARRVERGALAPAEMDAALARLTPTLDYARLAGATLAIEAVVEQLPVKLDVFRRLDAAVSPDTILASNTSTLPIGELAAAVRNPGRVLGLHFFSPARVMRLVEVVRARDTAPAALDAALAHVRALGKVPVVVGDCYGFVSNRLSMAYAGEALALLEEGASPAEVDAPLVAFGMPMGPLTMSDMAGNDISYLAHPGLRAAYGERAHPSPIWERLHRAGRHGQKAGRGFYDYPRGAAAGEPSAEVAALLDGVRAELGVAPHAIPPGEVLERVLYATVNEGARCIEEGVAASPDDVDTVMALGFGFPAARGGPMRWAREEVGYGEVVRALERYAREGRARLTPARWLRARA
jgi:3-hydroxyacyl-CoA dehydrogenase